MRSHRYHRSDTNAQDIIDALRAVGATVEHIGRPVDIAIGYRGVNYFAEIKTPKGKLRTSQAAFVQRWRGQVQVVRDADSALRMIGAVATARTT